MIQRSRRMYVRDYKSNENTIYSKRSKSVWVIKTRCDEGRKNAYIIERVLFHQNVPISFFHEGKKREREKFALRSNCAFLFLLFFLYIHIFAFLYNERSARERTSRRVNIWFLAFSYSTIYVASECRCVNREKEETAAAEEEKNPMRINHAFCNICPPIINE